jgi:hypothetical protein
MTEKKEKKGFRSWFFAVFICAIMTLGMTTGYIYVKEATDKDFETKDIVEPIVDLFSTDNKEPEWHISQVITLPLNQLFGPGENTSTNDGTQWRCAAVLDSAQSPNTTLNASANESDWNSTTGFRGYVNYYNFANTSFAASDNYGYLCRVRFGTATQVAGAYNYSRFRVNLTVTGDANANVADVGLVYNESVYNTNGNVYVSSVGASYIYINFWWWKATTSGYYINPESTISLTYTIYERY